MGIGYSHTPWSQGRISVTTDVNITYYFVPLLTIVPVKIIPFDYKILIDN